MWRSAPRPGFQSATVAVLVATVVAVSSLSLLGRPGPVSQPGNGGKGRGSPPGLVRLPPASANASATTPGPRSVLSGSGLATQYTLFPMNNTLLPGDWNASALSEPEYVAYDPGLNRLFLCGSGGVLEIDPSSFAVVGKLTAVSGASGIFYDASTGDLVLAARGNVTVVNASSDTIVERIAAPQSGQTVEGALLYDAAKNEVLVGNELNPTVNVVNLTLGRTVANFSLGSYDDAEDGAFDPENGQAYFTNYVNDTIIDVQSSTWRVAGTLSLPSSLYGFAEAVAVDPETGNVYVTSAFYCPGCYSQDALVELSGATGAVLHMTSLPGLMTGMAFAPSLDLLLVAEVAGNRIFALDPSNLSLVATVPIPGPSPLLLDSWWIVDVPQLDSVLIPSPFQDELSALSLTNFTVYRSIGSYAEPVSTAWDGACGCLIVADEGTDQLYFVNATNDGVERTVGLPGTPREMTYDATTAQLWVPLGGLVGTEGVEVLNGSTGAKVALLTASFATDSAFAPSQNQMFVVEGIYPTVVAVYNASTRSLLTKLDLSNTTDKIAFDPANGELYATNTGTNNVSIVNAADDTSLGTIPMATPTDAVTFDSGLREMLVGSADANEVLEINQTNSVVGKVSAPGPVDLLTDSTGQDLLDAFEGPAVFEVNLASGTNTSVPAGRGTASLTWLPSGALAASDPQGTIYFLAGSTGGLLSGASLVVEPEVVTVGAPLTLLASSEGGVGTLSYAYASLPPGCPGADAPDLDCQPSLPGIYSVSVVITDSLGHSVSASAALWVTASGPSSLLSFAASGLPAGASWGVSIAGGPAVSSVSDLLDLLVNPGTYPFSIAPAAGYGAHPASGIAQVPLSGETVIVPIAFAVTTYSVAFSETGLVPGVSWTVTLNGTVKELDVTGVTGTITFPGLAAGPYAYQITVLPDWEQSSVPYVGTETLSVASIQVSVAYSPVTFNVTFNETGLPAGAGWDVTMETEFSPGDIEPAVVLELSGTAGSAIVFAVTNGTFGYTATSVGYQTSGGSLQVQGPSAYSEILPFTVKPPSPATSTALGIAENVGVAVAAGGGAVLAGVAVVLVPWPRGKGRRPREPLPP